MCTLPSTVLTLLVPVQVNECCLSNSTASVFVEVLGPNKNMKEVKFKSDNKAGECPGVLQGDFSDTKKGLIVLQEWWGVNEGIKDLAGTIAQEGGFVTLVPDLYRGKTANNQEEAGHLMHSLDWSGAVDDIRGAVEYLDFDHNHENP